MKRKTASPIVRLARLEKKVRELSALAQRDVSTGQFRPGGAVTAGALRLAWQNSPTRRPASLKDALLAALKNPSLK